MNIVSKNLNEFLKFTYNKEKFEESDDIIPDGLIDTFYQRIENLLKLHNNDKNHPLIQKELHRILSINGKIPDKISDLLNESELFRNLLLESLNENFNIEKIKTIVSK